MSTRDKGKLWESRASRYLEAQGLRVIETGYRCRFGELDLICADRDSLVIVEVRARGGGSLLRSAETVDATKRRKLVLTTRHLLMTRPEWSQRPLRFDVIAIDGIDGAEPELRWIRNAFDAD